MTAAARHAASHQREVGRVTSPAGATIAYDKYGSGPPLVLVHGSFDNQESNWARVRPMLGERFTVYAVARRGRGETDATEGHRVEDEGRDVAAVVESIDEPSFLLGHSYGAQVALAAALQVPHHLRRLILYEPPWPDTVSREGRDRLEALAEAGDWEGFATSFFHDELGVPHEELNELRAAGMWSAIIADAKASLQDIRAMCGYAFEPDRFRELPVPVMLQVGTESPREIFASDALAAVLPNVRVEELQGHAHEGMQTAPDLYADSVIRFLLS